MASINHTLMAGHNPNFTPDSTNRVVKSHVILCLHTIESHVIYVPSLIEHVTIVTFGYFNQDGVVLAMTPPLTVINPQSTLEFRPRLLSSTNQTSEPLPITVSGEGGKV